MRQHPDSFARLSTTLSGSFRLTAPHREASLRYTLSNVAEYPELLWQSKHGRRQQTLPIAARTPSPMAPGQTKKMR
jgi:hypothetical protein